MKRSNESHTEVLKLVFVVIFVDDDDGNDVFKYANLKKFYS